MPCRKIDNDNVSFPSSEVSLGIGTLKLSLGSGPIPSNDLCAIVEFDSNNLNWEITLSLFRYFKSEIFLLMVTKQEALGQPRSTVQIIIPTTALLELTRSCHGYT